MYRVIHFFTDLTDNAHPYNVGDIFPRKGVQVDEDRLKELAGSDNRQGRPLIAEDAPTASVAGDSKPAVKSKKKNPCG